MIYKFIDNNGAEITLNSLSSLQALVESQTIKKDTKVKAGLRGKWVQAADIDEIKFEEEKIEETPKETDDIIDIITRETTPPPRKEKDKKTSIPKAHIEEDKIAESIVDLKSENNQAKEEVVKTEDKIELPTEELSSATEEPQGKTKEEELEEIYADEKMENINFSQSIKICFQKFFVFKGRASRSEFWWLYLFFNVTTSILFISNELVMALGWIMLILLIIPSLAAAVRRLHDVNTSGFFIFIGIVPVLGAIIVFVNIIAKGTLGKNRFGEYPLKFKKGK